MTENMSLLIHHKGDLVLHQQWQTNAEIYSLPADTSSLYHITGEGVTDSGKLIRFTREVTIKGSDEK